MTSSQGIRPKPNQNIPLDSIGMLITQGAPLTVMHLQLARRCSRLTPVLDPSTFLQSQSDTPREASRLQTRWAGWHNPHTPINIRERHYYRKKAHSPASILVHKGVCVENIFRSTIHTHFHAQETSKTNAAVSRYRAAGQWSRPACLVPGHVPGHKSHPPAHLHI